MGVKVEVGATLLPDGVVPVDQTMPEPDAGWLEHADEALEARLNGMFVPVTLEDLAQGAREHGVLYIGSPLIVDAIRKEEG